MFIKLNKEDWLSNSKNDLFAGVVSSIAILPEVIGFAILSGVHPLVALFSSAITLLVITFTGGRPAMVSAAAGSMAMVMAPLIKTHGLDYMIAATLLTGLLQLILGYLGVHRLLKYVSKTVMFGFVNALAILIFMSQVNQLPNQTIWTYVMVGLSVLLMITIPKVTKILPPALIVIILMTILSFFLKGKLQVVGDLGSMSSFTPSLGLPNLPLNLTTLSIIFPPAIALTLVGLTESLLTIPIVNKMTDSRGDNQQEVKAQGLANVLVGLFGGPAGCAMIGQAVINVKSGARTRLSTLIAGGSLLLLLFFFKDIMLQIPTAVLIGIMMIVAFDTFDWGSLKLFKEYKYIECFILVMTVSIIVYTHNLAIGILLGVLLSALVFMANSNHLEISQHGDTHWVKGLLFFASIHQFTDYFNSLADKQINIDLTHAKIMDESAMSGLKELQTEKEKQNSFVIYKGIESLKEGNKE